MINDAEKTMDLMFRSSNLMMMSATTIMDIVAAMADMMGKNSDLKFLNDHVVNSGGQLRTITCSQEYLPEIISELNKRGVRAHVFDGLYMDGTRILTYRDVDERDVISTINKIRHEHNIGGTVTEATLRHGANDQIIMLKGLNKYDLQMVMEMAKKESIPMCFRSRDEDDNMVYFKRTDKEKLRTIERTLAMQKSNPIVYEAIKKQMDYEIQHEKDLIYKVLSRKEMATYFITDLNGTTMEVSVDDIKFRDIKNGIDMTVGHKDIGSKNDITMMIASMDNPQALSAEEYKAYIESGRNKNILYEKDKASGRPEFTKDEIKEIRRLERVKDRENLQLVEAKLAMENPEREFYDYSYLNNEMRMQAFEAYEEMNKDMLEDRNEKYEIDEATISEAKNMYIEMVQEEYEGKFVDIQYGDYSRTDPARQLEIEKMIDNTYDYEKEYLYDVIDDRLDDDLNNNYVPDHLEY